jgi:NAD(P)-dependent dehydrogenase (short-subunit alcohol dehydrogenase family)
MIMEKQVAVVTGANRGIGLEVSRQLADDGLCVVMTGRNESEGMTARDSLDTDGRDVRFHQLDVTNDADVTSLAAYLEQAFGRLDVLVNNAGILFDDDRLEASVLNVSLERIRLTMEVNFYGALRVCQGMAALLCKSGAGRVVNVSSGLGQLDNMVDGYPAYGVSKTSLNALTRLYADALRKDDVLVNAMCPGLVATDMGGPKGRPVREGADTASWLATLPNDGPTGGLFRDRQPIPW